jgi:hypothetical protein
MAFDKSQKVLTNILTSDILANAGAFIQALIVQRMERGQYLAANGFNASAATSIPYSRAHAKWRQKRGLQTSVVDMMVTGITRDNMDHRPIKDQDGVFIEFGYLPTAEPTALKRALWHNVTGAGKNRRIRRWVGLTGPETALVLDELKDSIRDKLK